MSIVELGWKCIMCVGAKEITLYLHTCKDVEWLMTEHVKYSTESVKK